MSQYILSLLLGYIIGSVPTAYLLVKWKSQVDIRSAGTGNVGAMNTFDVTSSKWLGFLVFLIDAIKGALAAYITGLIVGKGFWLVGLSGIGALLGHNYPLWLRFKGGRGLSTAVGITLVIGWIVVPVWCSIWLVHYTISKNIHLANITASFLTPLVFVVCPARLLSIVLPASTGTNDFIMLVSVLLLLVVIRHVEYVVQFSKSASQKIH